MRDVPSARRPTIYCTLVVLPPCLPFYTVRFTVIQLLETAVYASSAAASELTFLAALADAGIYLPPGSQPVSAAFKWVRVSCFTIMCGWVGLVRAPRISSSPLFYRWVVVSTCADSPTQAWWLPTRCH